MNAIPGMADYLSTHGVPPEQINNHGIAVGANAPVGFSAALLPYLRASGAKSALATQAARVAAQLDATTNLFGRPPTYYDENLILFGMGGATQPIFAFGRDGELQVKWAKR